MFPPHVINDVLLLLQRDVSEEVGPEAKGPGGEGAPMGGKQEQTISQKFKMICQCKEIESWNMFLIEIYIFGSTHICGKGAPMAGETRTDFVQMWLTKN